MKVDDTDKCNFTYMFKEEKDIEEYSTTIHSLWTTIKQIFTRRSRRVRNEDVENSGVNLQLETYC